VAVFGHIRRLPEQAPAHAALCLAVDTRPGRKPDNRQRWRRARGRPRNTWIRQVEVDSRLSAWDTAGDRCRWRAQRPRWLRVHDDDDDDDDDVGKIEWASLYLENILIADVSERGFNSAET